MYYNEIAKGYDNLHREEQEKKLKIIVSKIKPKEDEKLLDVGCGTGFACEYLKCDYSGIDPSSEMVSQANKRYGFKFMAGTAESLPFPDSTFDIVISVTAIHNFDDINKGLMEMARVGKDRCRYAFSVLKKSSKLREIRRLIKMHFTVKSEAEEDKDEIIFCEKKKDI